MQNIINTVVVGFVVFVLSACAANERRGDVRVADGVVVGSNENGTNAQWPSFQKIDSNGNGYIDRTEAVSVPVLDFGLADNDGDGRLNPAEFEAAKSAAPARGGESDVPVGGMQGAPAGTNSEYQRVPGDKP